LGAGFLESVYDNALAIELARSKIDFERQCQISVRYRNQFVGHFVADYLVDNRLILELKAINKLDMSAHAQILNYLKAANIQVGILLNFGGNKLEIKRLVKNLKEERSI